MYKIEVWRNNKIIETVFRSNSDEMMDFIDDYYNEICIHTKARIEFWIGYNDSPMVEYHNLYHYSG